MSESAKIGASRLDIAIEQAYYTAAGNTEALVPGGAIVPLTPAAGAQITRANQYLLAFDTPQGQQLSLNRIWLDLPVWMAEEELEKNETETTTLTNYQTFEEAEEAAAGKGGFAEEVLRGLSPLTAVSRYEAADTVNTIKRDEQRTTEKAATNTYSSVLPVTVTVTAAIMSADGVEWSEQFDIDLIYLKNEPGQAWGEGRLQQYADLINPIPIDPTRVYGLAFSLRVPTITKTNTQLTSASQGADRPGEVSLFYDILQVNVGK